MKSTPPTTFGNRLRQARRTAGMGLRSLATAIGKSPGYLSDLENDKVPPPSVGVVLAISRTLNAGRRDLLAAAGKVDPELSDYVVHNPSAADFLRLAREREFDADDWERLSQLAEISRLGRDGEEEK